jgi:uncharacterized UPF0160 family protein
MNTEEDEFNRIERESAMRKEAVKDTIRYRDAFPKDYRLQKPWVGLTDEEIVLICGECAASAHRHDDISYARAIEAKLKEKNI